MKWSWLWSGRLYGQLFTVLYNNKNDENKLILFLKTFRFYITWKYKHDKLSKTKTFWKNIEWTIFGICSNKKNEFMYSGQIRDHHKVLIKFLLGRHHFNHESGRNSKQWWNSTCCWCWCRCRIEKKKIILNFNYYKMRIMKYSF